MSDLVGNPEDRFSRDAAHMVHVNLLELLHSELSQQFKQ